MSSEENCEKSTKADADTLEQDRSSTKELGLDPAAWRVECSCDISVIHLVDDPEELPYVPDRCPDCESRLEATPLVRLSDVDERIEAHLVEAQRQKRLISTRELELENPEEVYQGWVLVESVLRQIKQELTQKGGSD